MDVYVCVCVCVYVSLAGFRVTFVNSTHRIKLYGMIDDVTASQQLIKTKFVDVIICEELKLQLFGWYYLTYNSELT